MKFANQDRTDAGDTYDYFVGKLHAFSTNGQISADSYKRMTDALVGLGDLTQPVPPADKFYDPTFVKAAWAATNN